MLTCMLAIFGLGMAYTDYNKVFGTRTEDTEDGHLARKVWRQEIIMVNFLTGLTILACFIKQWFAELWYDFRCPNVFYKTFI